MAKCLPCFGPQKPPHQMVMLGLEGAGKTTILYKLKMPNWKDIAKDLKRSKDKAGKAGNESDKNGKEKSSQQELDPGYHYEELHSSNLGPYGIWDVPGHEAYIPLWPIFYRYIRVAAVLFVVDGHSDPPDPKKWIDARDALRRLLNEDELRDAAVICIINVGGDKNDKNAVQNEKNTRQEIPDIVHRIEDALGINEIKMQDSAGRFRNFYLDGATVQKDEKAWKDILEAIVKVMISMGCPPK